MTDESLIARNGDVRLAGTLWLPDREPRCLILMHPGSGPSDRDNDVLFPPIRAALLGAGAAVCSFDKRGVGGSSGSWLDADIPLQAADLIAGLDAARDRVGQVPVGLFGHSQGGWVVLEAAAHARAGFVITNSGPAVTPRVQETYSTGRTLRRRGWADDAVDTGVDTFSRILDLLAEPFETGWPHARELPLVDELIGAGVFVPAEAALWDFARRLMPYDPGPALDALAMPLLALLGEDDDVVPVDLSATAFREAVASELLDLRILPLGDHRLQHRGQFVPGYLDAVTGFVTRMGAVG